MGVAATEVEVEASRDLSLLLCRSGETKMASRDFSGLVLLPPPPTGAKPLATLPRNSGMAALAASAVCHVSSHLEERAFGIPVFCFFEVR